jgi:hypothetical protein
VDAFNPSYSSVDGVLFDKNQKVLIQYPWGRVGGYAIPSGVISIGEAFFGCSGLTSVTIPASITLIEILAFYDCSSLTNVYFEGNAPSTVLPVFDPGSRATIYYLPGMTGWHSTFADQPTVLWNPEILSGDPSFGVQADQFGFTVTGTTGLVIVVEACTNLFNPVWSPLGTNSLTDGSSYFGDPEWTNYQTRIYRLRSP